MSQHDAARDAIEAAYAAARVRTLERWARADGSEDPVPLPYDERALAYTVGATFDAPATLRLVLNELAALSAADSKIVPVPDESLHFTFLAITPHRWTDVAAMPDATAMRSAIRRHLGGLPFELDALRLLPAANALLLAGLPSAAMLATRDGLIADLVAAGLGPSLAERYDPVFPPVFWHTTLARSRTVLAPTALRSLYERHAATSFGSVAMTPPRLHAANYNWTQRHRLD